MDPLNDKEHAMAARRTPDEPGDRSAPTDTMSGGIDRRGFLKAAGFTLAGTVLAACEPAPIEKAIPYLIQPEEITPGRAYHYASTCAGCTAGCGLLVKNRDGRPIKLEGNPNHPVSRGGLCAVGQAAILGLYDSHRLSHPLRAGKEADWAAVDAAVMDKLAALQSGGGAVRFLTGNITSPSLQAMIDQFLAAFPDAAQVTWEALSSSAIVDAHQRTHGVAVMPRYHFDRAEVIVGFDADFLGTWISPVEFTAGYRQGRTLEGDSPRFSHHTQFESRMSVTGSKADQRHRVTPGEHGLLLSHLAARLAPRAGVAFSAAGLAPAPVPGTVLDEMASRLWAARGRSLVVCGLQDTDVQTLCNFLNHVLGNYGATLSLTEPSYQRRGADGRLQALLEELSAGTVSALLIDDVNPVYGLPQGKALADAIGRVPLVVSFAQRLDETSRLAHFVCPDRHFLESWADTESVHGVVSYSQPVVPALGKTRPLIETLALWSGDARSARDILRVRQPDQAAWDRVIHDGYGVIKHDPVRPGEFQIAAVAPIRSAGVPASGSLTLALYPKVGMLDGRHAYNPWLQEMPDPITKIVWDNYASLSPAMAERAGLTEGDVVRLQVAGDDGQPQALELPVFVQPGQHDQVVAVALGYGSDETKRFSGAGPRWLHERPTVGSDGRVGVNAAPLISRRGDTLIYAGRDVTLTPTGTRIDLASSQEYGFITVPEDLAVEGQERRPAVRETALAAVLANHGNNDEHGEAEDHEGHATLWPADHDYPDHHWGMAIDLTACTGCSACVVSCQVENNIPVVGKDEVRRHRVMHWLRIDRYYEERDGGIDVAHQPMLCHHCDNAPCETVCPVLATVHSSEGLNQQVYNRCIGTRYCANNCPYKVRRFNWFDYPHEDVLHNQVLNPDVVVRSRGVMEKCTFCIQRIQEAKIEAKRTGSTVPLLVQPACQQSCPAGAIVFGDMNDPDSAVSRLIRSQRHYRLLEETNVKPSVGYLDIVRNRDGGGSGGHHG